MNEPWYASQAAYDAATQAFLAHAETCTATEQQRQRALKASIRQSIVVDGIKYEWLRLSCCDESLVFPLSKQQLPPEAGGSDAVAAGG